MTGQDLAEFVRPRLWNSTDWEEVLVLLSATLDDATPLIELIERETDAFGSMKRLAVRCVSANTRLASTPAYRAQRLGPVQDMLKSASAFERDSAARALLDYPFRWTTVGIATALAMPGHGINRQAFAVLASIGDDLALSAVAALREAAFNAVSSAVESEPPCDPGARPASDAAGRVLEFALRDVLPVVGRTYASIDRAESAQELFDLVRRVAELKLRVRTRFPVPGLYDLEDELHRSLVQLGDTALPVAIEAARSGSPADRILACRVLGALMDRRALPVLREALSNDGPEAVAAARALAALHDTQSAHTLGALLGGNEAIALAAADALADVGGHEHLHLLQTHLERCEAALEAARANGKLSREYASEWKPFAATARALLALGQEHVGYRVAKELEAAEALERPGENDTERSRTIFFAAMRALRKPPKRCSPHFCATGRVSHAGRRRARYELGPDPAFSRRSSRSLAVRTQRIE